MAELVDGKGRKGDVEERYHLVAHGVGIELAPYRILHPRVGHQNPPGTDGSAQAREPSGCQVEAWRNLLPAKIHHSHEG